VARAAFSVAYMSNAKWYKALRAIAQVLAAGFCDHGSAALGDDELAAR